MAEVLPSEIEADLQRLEIGLRQLKIQYDMFFAGSIPRQPLELRSEIESLIRRNSQASIRKYAARFHLNALVSRYNIMSELWAKTLRQLEEGDRPAPAVADRAGKSEQTIASCTLKDQSADFKVLKVLHQRYLDARRKSGEKDVQLSFEAFAKGVSKQAGKLRDAAGCEDVELRVVVLDRKVQVKARPAR